MTIVEVVILMGGFRLLQIKLLQIRKFANVDIECNYFLFSAALDNLTSSIVMAPCLQNLLKIKKTFGCFMVLF